MKQVHNHFTLPFLALAVLALLAALWAGLLPSAVNFPYRLLPSPWYTVL